MRFRTVHLNVYTIVSEEFALNIRYQMVPNHVHKPRAVHLTVDFIPVTGYVKLATPLCALDAFDALDALDGDVFRRESTRARREGVDDTTR